MRRIRNSLLLVGALLLACGEGAAATDGFFLGLDFHTSHIDAEDERAEAPTGSVFIDDNGGGVTFFLGYGITPSFPLRLNLSVAEHETSDTDVKFFYSSVTIEGAYLFRNGEPLRPYLLGGFGGFAVRSRQDDFDFETTGPGFVFGTGMVYFLSEHFALDFGLRGDLINWDKQRATLTFPNGSQAIVETPVEGDGAAAKFLFGVSGWF
jgi:opacity protein-like surface antigen